MTAASGTHPCPVTKCPVPVPGRMLMCALHWRQVPARLRANVWAAWRNGAGAGTTVHYRAIEAAVAAVNAKAAAR